MSVYTLSADDVTLMFTYCHVLCCVVSFDDSAESKCSEYCGKALEYCSCNPDAYQLMGSCLLSKQDYEVSHIWFS